MALDMGALGSLSIKLLQLLHGEYELQKSVKKKLEFVTRELKSTQVALNKVASVPWYQLDEQVKLWAGEVKEASYDMEDILDTFLVRVEDREPDDLSRLERALKKMGGLSGQLMARRDIAGAIEDIKKKVEEIAARRARYKVDEIEVKPPPSTTIDPRLLTSYTEASELVGIIEPRDALIRMLSIGEHNTSSKELKIVSVMGSGGLGKTTLAKVVYDKVNSDFDCRAFVPVGRNPDPSKVLRDILNDLIKDSTKKENTYDPYKRYKVADRIELLRDLRQLIQEVREFLERKRYCIVIDDIWDTKTWGIIKYAFVDSNCGSRIIATTRISQVSKEIGEVYEMKELSDNQSRKLLYNRAFGGEDKLPHNYKVAEESDKILHKCRGVPLAIITIASLLATIEINHWSDVYDSIGFGHGDNTQGNMEKVLSFSYYDLPCHLRTCMLYLSVFPEDYFVEKNMLIWRWIAEGLVHTTEQGKDDFDIGDSYFHELINRGMILPIEHEGILDGCRVHDLILHMIRHLSREEEFLDVQDGNNLAPVPNEHESRGNARRLAFHRVNPIQVNDKAMQKVTSFSAYACSTNYKIDPVSTFKSLRLLALEDCRPLNNGYLRTEHMGKLLHLRYLGLQNTPIRELHKEIGHLKFLQTLMLNETGIEELPSSLGKLTKLMCLRADEKTRVPDWIGKLTSLVELEIYPCADDKCFVKELGKLRELMVLKTRINLRDQAQGLEFVQSLSKLQKIKSLNVGMTESFDFDNGVLEPSLVLHANLQVLKLDGFYFSRLPATINPQAIPNLYSLHLMLSELDQQDMEVIGKFQKLCHLQLGAFKLLSSGIRICGGFRFRNLKSFSAFFHPPMFIPGAMPRLETIMLHIPVRDVKIDNPGLDFGLGHLSSLKNLMAGISCIGCLPTELEEVEAAIRHAVHIHPNRPALSLLRAAEDKMATSNDFREKFERQVLRMGKLNERVGEQKKLQTTMRDEALSIAEKITDMNARNKIQRFVEQIDAILSRVEHELEGDKDNYDLISRVANDSAGMERALAILTDGYMRLAAMLDDLRTVPSLQDSTIEKLNEQSQKLTEQIYVQKNYNSTLYIYQAQEIARLILEEHPINAKIQRSSASLPGILADIVESMDAPSSSNQQMKHISRGNQVGPTDGDSVMSIAISEPMLHIHAESSFAQSSTYRSDIRILDLLNRKFARIPSWINPQNLPDLSELHVVVSEDVNEKDIEILGGFTELRKLILVILQKHRLRLTICGCSGFQNLRSLDIAVPLQFQQGAMPKLEYINFAIPVAEFKDANISLDFGLGNLSSLQLVKANISCDDNAARTEVEEAETAIRHAVHVHPNHPTLDIRRVNEDKMGPLDAAGSRKLIRQMYKFWINKEIQKLNEQIDVENNDNSALCSQAQEMAHSTQEGHPSIAKIHGSSSASMLEIAILRKQLTAVENMDDGAYSYNQLMQDISKDKEVEPEDGDSVTFYLLQALSLHEQIGVQKDCFSALFSQAQEMAHSIPEGQPSIVKIQWTTASMLDIYILQNQLDAIAGNTDKLCDDPNKLVKFIKDQEQLLALYKDENKRMAKIKEELTDALKVYDHATR